MFSLLAYGRALLQRESARIIAGVSAAAAAAALVTAENLGITLSGDFVAGVAVFAGVVATEAIRHLVYAPATVEKMRSPSAEGVV